MKISASSKFTLVFRGYFQGETNKSKNRDDQQTYSLPSYGANVKWRGTHNTVNIQEYLPNADFQVLARGKKIIIIITTTINAKTEEIWETGQAQFITYKEKKEKKKEEDSI